MAAVFMEAAWGREGGAHVTAGGEVGGRQASPTLYLVAGFVLAVVFIGVALVVAMGGHMFGGGMMGQGPDGGGWSAVLVVVTLLAAGVVAAAFALLRGGMLGRRTAAAEVSPEGPPASTAPSPAPAPQTVRQSAAPVPPVPVSELEAVTLRLLDRDERLLFLEIKEKGGAALQKDIGSRDGFSRSKVTRLLDRLEAKGLIVREREGMTNRVRLLTRSATEP